MRQGRLESINVSNGGVPKRPVAEARIRPEGVEGDAQNDRANHGGPERAVSVYAAEAIAALAAEGHPISPGSTGENLTISGIAWREVVPGTELRIGPVRLVVTRYTVPCYKIAASFADGRFLRISQEQHPGWSRVYTRVLEGGTVRVGDGVEVTAAPPSAAP
jgi:MOSC domain-containing protein YiiM